MLCRSGTGSTRAASTPSGPPPPGRYRAKTACRLPGRLFLLPFRWGRAASCPRSGDEVSDAEGNEAATGAGEDCPLIPCFSRRVYAKIRPPVALDRSRATEYLFRGTGWHRAHRSPRKGTFCHGQHHLLICTTGRLDGSYELRHGWGSRVEHSSPRDNLLRDLERSSWQPLEYSCRKARDRHHPGRGFRDGGLPGAWGAAASSHGHDNHPCSGRLPRRGSQADCSMDCHGWSGGSYPSHNASGHHL